MYGVFALGGAVNDDVKVVAVFALHNDKLLVLGGFSLNIVNQRQITVRRKGLRLGFNNHVAVVGGYVLAAACIGGNGKAAQEDKGGKQGGGEANPTLLTNGGIALDDGAKSVTVDGEGVSLTPIEYNILLLLMKNPGRVFSTSQIYELVWNDPSLGSENTVAVHIRHLREKLEIDPANPRYIKVVWGLGYKMEKV